MPGIHPYFDVSGTEARGLLYGLLEMNKDYLRTRPEAPSVRSLIQQGKVRYREADENEHWQTYRELVEAVERDGIAYGDCEDLACAVAAEDQVRYGVATLPYAYTPQRGLFHVVSAVPTSSAPRFGGKTVWPIAMGSPTVTGYVLQDPSAAAGMGVTFGGVRGRPERSRGLGIFAESVLDGLGLPTRDFAGEGGRLLGRAFREQIFDGLLGDDARSAEAEEGERFGATSDLGSIFSGSGFSEPREAWARVPSVRTGREFVTAAQRGLSPTSTWRETLDYLNRSS